MKSRSLVGVLGLLVLLLVGLAWRPWGAQAQPANGLEWIWFNEGDPTRGAPAATRYFRRAFTIDRPVQPPVDEGVLDITADNAFTVWVNGAEVGRGSEWKQVFRFDVKKHLVHGQNVIAVEARNDSGPAGLMVRLTYAPNGQSKLILNSDRDWKAAQKAVAGWQKVDFDDRKWEAVKVLGPVGKTGPWQSLAWGGSAVSKGQFTAPEGFVVENVAHNPNPADPFSLINMTFDNRGRLLVSQERGPILLCTDPDDKGAFRSVKPYCTLVKNCHGMCWVADALLLVGEGPKGTGLYRCKSTEAGEMLDQVELLHRFNGGIGEHGPHTIIHGPDNWLYMVIGNHAWATPEQLAANSPLTRWPTGRPGPDQGKPGSTEDVLLPRLNDARGHAANILAPGGTIWRMDQNGKNLSLVAAGFRNHFDAAFSPQAELFTFDSDMEWDVGLPWYRAVRICHCPPGADFVWRTGAANTPDYYLDSLPPLAETGRGSPVGVEFYDHRAFPAKYRGAFFMADWSIGRIWAVHLKRDGASYKGEVENFCSGAPMNVTDCAVGPDGALYFTMGGRGTKGGVYRIVYKGTLEHPREEPVLPVQPLSAWGREEARKLAAGFRFADLKGEPSEALLTFWQNHGPTPPGPAVLLPLLESKRPELRAHAVWLLGVNGYKEGQEGLIKALEDRDPLVRRRACEALLRAGFEPAVIHLTPLLSDLDRFVRTAARLLLQRIPAEKWVQRLWKLDSDLATWEGIIALCKTGQAEPHARAIFRHLHKGAPNEPVEILLAYLRTLQMALFHIKERPGAVRGIALECLELFPHTDARVNRELAILLTHFKRAGQLEEPVPTKLIEALLAAKDDPLQQIHYFYCLRLIPEGWSAEEKQAVTAWYNSTRLLTGGGHSFTPFLENIYREILAGFAFPERKALLDAGDTQSLPALVLVQLLQKQPQPELLPALKALLARLAAAPPGKVHRGDELKLALVEVQMQTILRDPRPESFPLLVEGLNTPNKLLLLDVVEALKKNPSKPKAEDPVPYRNLLLASKRLDAPTRWKAVELLRHWSNNKQFGAPDKDWKIELDSWARWYGQTFPKQPALPDVTGDRPAESKYRFEELLTFLEKDGRNGDVARGRQAFEKAQCLKCHKYGKEGEGVGPDLTTLSRRFKRGDVLESLIYPSKVISDQYRSTQFLTIRGQSIVGLAAAPMDGVITVLQSDGSKVNLKVGDIDQQFTSLISVMPEKLLDTLEKQEIADLFAFLESEPAK